MSYIIRVDNRNGESLFLRASSKTVIGGWLGSFLIALDNYSSHPPDSKHWLHTLDEYLNYQLADKVQLICKSFITGNWEYSPSESIIYQVRTGDFQTSEAEFQKIAIELQNKWVNCNELCSDIALLHKWLTEIDLQKIEGLYHSIETLNELDSLYNLLRLFGERGTSEVRISIV